MKKNSKNSFMHGEGFSFHINLFTINFLLSEWRGFFEENDGYAAKATKNGVLLLVVHVW